MTHRADGNWFQAFRRNAGFHLTDRHASAVWFEPISRPIYGQSVSLNSDSLTLSPQSVSLRNRVVCVTAALRTERHGTFGFPL